MSIIRALLAGFLSVALIGLSGAAQADGLDSIMKAKVIKIAVPQDFAPFGSAGPDLKPQGLDIDMANLIAKELGVKAEIVAVTSANRIPYLQTKKVDLVISSLGKNAEREKVIDFSKRLCAVFLRRVRREVDSPSQRRKISPARPSAPRAARSKSRN